jgi:hypothetical protein
MSSHVSRRSAGGRRLLQLVATMAASAGLALAGSAAVASSSPRHNARPIASAFSVLREAHSAATGSSLPEPIGGATTTVLAGVYPTGDTVYVDTLQSGDICVVDQEPASPAGVAPSDTSGLIAVGCSGPTEAEQTGIALLAPSVAGSEARITLLVPNGVQTVVFEQSDGTAITQAVVNNVAEYAARGLISANFVTPGGQDVSEAVPPTAASQ